MEQRYQTIARLLSADIEAGVYKHGEALPTRSELALRHGVARATLDRAVASLIRKGILNARRGAGTLVSSRGHKTRTIAVVQSGYHPTSRILAPPDWVKPDIVTFDSIATRSARNSLRRFDGLLWCYPEDRELEWARETPPEQPQLLVNRHLSDFNYVSTDHRGAILRITESRLTACPTGIPVFLSTSGHTAGLVWGMREDGFVDACRKADRFYEIIQMPASFEGKTAVLQEKFRDRPSRPLIFVSGSLSNTGALIAWAGNRGLAMREEIYYSDFDNEYPRDVWGITVTSFRQNYPALMTTALESMQALLADPSRRIQKLLPPELVQGDT